MLELSLQNYLHGHFSDEVSRETLAEILGLVDRTKRVALLGFSDYTKHIINNFGDSIAAVFDIDPRFSGIKFRGKEVFPASRLKEMAPGIDVLVVCIYNQIIDYHEVIADAHLQGLPLLWPENFDGQQGHKYNLESQSSRYRFTQVDDRLGEPSTMMPRETVIFLLELLRASMRVPGAVAEIGVWQGGSAWNMCHLMKNQADERDIHLFDFFDMHTPSNPEAIMCLDEIERRFSFYEKAHFYMGPADNHMRSLIEHKFCFVHIDLGYIHDVVEFFWDRLELGGIMVLDNYGHVRAWPNLFDKFFAARGYSVIRSPFSYQAFITK